MNPQDGLIAEPSEHTARSEFLRMTAFEHLFSIIDGEDRDAAIADARAWLKEIYGESYEMLSAVAQQVRKIGDTVDWPEELPEEL